MVALLAACLLASGIKNAADAAESGREPLYGESLRPQFHFTARYWDEYQLHPPNHHEGWINDLNGLMFHDGEYHLFAQRWWSAWLHAVSTDLIHWEELRPAFGKGGRFGGTQSGGGVVDLHNSSGLGNGVEPPMLAFWSSTDNVNQCMSYSLDKGRTWTKYENNPVLVHPYRDPNVFWYAPDQKWIMILYGPGEESIGRGAYGFNGESNDAHDLREFTAGEWTCSAIRVFDNGRVVANDPSGSSEGRIDIGKQAVGAEVLYVGAKSNQAEFLNGDIAEILLYDRPLSDQETEEVILAMQSKWGLRSSTRAPAIPTNGLVLRLDAAKVSLDDDGRVWSWKSLTREFHQLTQMDVKKQPRRIGRSLGNRPVIRFEGNQFLRGGPVLEKGDDSFTMVALWRRTDANGSQVVFEQNTMTLQAGRRAALLTVSRQETENVYLLFSSKNLLEWQKLDTKIPDSFECPDMFELPVENRADQKKWVVVDGNGDYVLGSFDGARFTTETEKQKGDYGRNFYATMTFANMPDSDPRRIQLAWMRGWDDYPKNMPFNQQISFPCELSLRSLPRGIVMCRYPVGEISGIYGDSFSMVNLTLKPGENPLSKLEGELFDIQLAVDIANSDCSEIVLNLKGNTVKYDIPRKMIYSCGSSAPLEARDGRIELRILVDRLSIETFGNRGEVSITNIAYQAQTSPHLAIESIGGKALIPMLKVHKLNSIWNAQLSP
jgi:sucrose-6-phosphate hydrolase SacC (GH32 family)